MKKSTIINILILLIILAYIFVWIMLNKKEKKKKALVLGILFSIFTLVFSSCFVNVFNISPIENISAFISQNNKNNMYGTIASSVSTDAFLDFTNDTWLMNKLTRQNKFSLYLKSESTDNYVPIKINELIDTKIDLISTIDYDFKHAYKDFSFSGTKIEPLGNDNYKYYRSIYVSESLSKKICEKIQVENPEGLELKTMCNKGYEISTNVTILGVAKPKNNFFLQNNLKEDFILSNSLFALDYAANKTLCFSLTNEMPTNSTFLEIINAKCQMRNDSKIIIYETKNNNTDALFSLSNLNDYKVNNSFITYLLLILSFAFLCVSIFLVLRKKILFDFPIFLGVSLLTMFISKIFVTVKLFNTVLILYSNLYAILSFVPILIIGLVYLFKKNNNKRLEYDFIL